MIKAVIFDMYETLITLYNSPNYFGTQMAEDLGIEPSTFLKDWSPREEERSIGKISFEEILKQIMRKNNCYSRETFQMVVSKRIASKRECFSYLDEGIIPMLTNIKEKGIKIGLISNCFSEEVTVIRESILLPYFDAVCLSYEEGIVKPNKKIFYRCMKRLDVLPEECIYIGDGGSFELEAASEVGMKPMQATWYLK